MVSPISSRSGIAYPDDLALLKRVYDRVCHEEGLAVGSEDAAYLSKCAMGLFSQGEFDETILYERLRDRIPRR